MDYRTEEVFRGELLRDERILWSEQPDPRVLFTRADIGLIPFGLFWLGFMVFWELAALGLLSDGAKRGSGPSLFFSLFGALFVAFGVYIAFGRFVAKYCRKKRTYYAVTNQRVLVLTRLFGTSFQSTLIADIPTVDKSVGRSGVGTVRFGHAAGIGAAYGNTGLDAFGRLYGPEVPTFYDIKDADTVYQMVTDLKSKLAREERAGASSEWQR